MASKHSRAVILEPDDRGGVETTDQTKSQQDHFESTTHRQEIIFKASTCVLGLHFYFFRANHRGQCFVQAPNSLKQH